MNAKRPILIIDDEQAAREVTAVVKDAGYDVLQTGSPEQAISIAAANSLSAILLDIELPQGKGIDVCRAIRRMGRHQVTPIIFLARYSESEAVAEAFAAGGDDFMSKPVDAIVLQARLKVHIQRVEYWEHHLVRTRLMLKQYLSKRTLEVVDIASRTGTPPLPEQRRVVILFSDIRGFTALSEEMPPDRMFPLLGAQLASQVELIHNHGGYVDKFGGDGVMAVFDSQDMARQSCICAARIMQRAAQFEGSDAERIRQLGIGIHMGPVVIGNIGSPEHLDYSVIGSAVNLAARLCGHARPMSIVVSKAVRDAVGNDPQLIFHAERRVQIRGLRDLVPVYDLHLAEPLRY